MPLCPAQVTQCRRPDILAVLVAVARMMCRIIQRSCPLEVMESGSEFPFRYARGAEHPMGNTQRRRVFMSFGRGKELHGSVRLFGDFASDILACPNPIEDGKLLRGIGQILKARLRPQQNPSRL